MKIDKTEKFWDRLSKNYDGRSPKRGKTYLKTVELTNKYLASTDAVLDFGCATGSLTIDFAKNVKEIIGIDISSKMIDLAKKKAADFKAENTKFIHSTVWDERLEKESFNVVLSFNILHLLEDSDKFIQRIYELLKPGGFFISATACMGENKSLLSRFFSLLSKAGIVPRIIFFKASELENIITKRNFQIVETEKLSRSPLNYFIAAKKR